MSEEKDKGVFWKKEDTKTPDGKTIDVTDDSKKAAAALKVMTPKPAKTVEHTAEEIGHIKDILLGLGFYKKQNGGEKEQFVKTRDEDGFTVGRTFSKANPTGNFWVMKPNAADLPPEERFLKTPEVKKRKTVQAFYDVRDKGGDITKYMPADPRYTPQAATQKQEVAIPQPQTVAVAQAPNEVIREAEAMASALYNVVEKQHLYVLFSGKKYLQLEAWQLLGKFCNDRGIVESVGPVEYFGAKGFEAKAVIKDVNGEVIASAEAVCLDDEPNWKNKPIFQLKSMAQTRALSKAYRSCLSFIVSIAGYAATPAEEMEGVK